MIVYTTNNCIACKMTKLHLKKLGIAYTERNVTESERIMEQAKATGYTSMPIVVLNGEVIASGFQPDKLNELS